MRTGQTYHTREIETMLRSKQGQAKLRSTLEQTRLLPIDFLGEDGAPGSAQQILEQIKNQARQEAAEILAQQKIPSLPQEPVALSLIHISQHAGREQRGARHERNHCPGGKVHFVGTKRKKINGKTYCGRVPNYAASFLLPF